MSYPPERSAPHPSGQWPLIGRRVWVFSDGNSHDSHGTYLDIVEHGAPFDCGVAFVHDSGTINVGGVDHCGYPIQFRDIPLLAAGETPEMQGPYATWMPYQQAQHAAQQEKTSSSIALAEARRREAFNTLPDDYEVN